MKLTALLLFVAMLIAIWWLPAFTPVLGVTILLFSLAIGIISIIKKHKQSEKPYPKILKEILILILTILLAMLLGGLAGMYANQYVTQHFGVIVGMLSALVASFTIGYLVKWGLGMVTSKV